MQARRADISVVNGEKEHELQRSDILDTEDAAPLELENRLTMRFYKDSGPTGLLPTNLFVLFFCFCIFRLSHNSSALF
ncbi:MAG: hypothetical protein JWM68_37 [Verrucomicrobiales bacterium]|nr:hypothetical protein [Verrucomicrobiales bacterium]